MIGNLHVWLVVNGKPYLKRYRLPLDDGFEQSMAGIWWDDVLEIIREMTERVPMNPTYRAQAAIIETWKPTDWNERWTDWKDGAVFSGITFLNPFKVAARYTGRRGGLVRRVPYEVLEA